MGKIIKLDTELLIPTQQELCGGEKKFGRLFNHYIHNPGDRLIWVLPSKKEKGKYLIGDGHNTSCLIDALNESGNFDLYGWIPNSDYDFIPEELTTEFSNDYFSENNHYIKYRFEELNLGTYPNSPSSIKRMRSMYSWLKNSGDMFLHFADVLDLGKE